MTSDGTGPQAKGPPLPEQLAEQVAELAAEGLGRNAVARALGTSPTTVTRAAEIAGIQFDGSLTESATKARADQLAQDRMALAELSAAIAFRAGRRLLIETGATVLDPTTVRALATAYGVAADKLAALSATVTDETSEHAAAEVWLEALTLQLEAAADGRIPADEHGNVPIQFGPPREDQP